MTATPKRSPVADFNKFSEMRGIAMRKPYEKADFRLMMTDDADVLTISRASANNVEHIVEDGDSFANLFPTL